MYLPAPPSSSADHHGDSDAEGREVLLPETTIMLTVEEEEDESAEKGSPSAGPSIPRPDDKLPQPEHLPNLEVTPQAVLAHQIKDRTQSLVSNTSLLSVPLILKDLSEARPCTELMTADVAEPVSLKVPMLTEETEQMGNRSDPLPEPEKEKPATSPEIASISVVDTARTIATQTSLLYEPLLRMTHGDGSGEGRLLGLPELKGAHAMDRHLVEEDVTGLNRKSNGVQNLTFISPLEGQQKAKRF